MSAVLPVALYQLWHIDGQIPDIDAPRPKPQAKKKAANAHRIAGLVSGRRRAHAAAQDALDDTDAPAGGVAEEVMDRSYDCHYRTVLLWCVAMRIWGSESITKEEAIRAHDCHAQACQGWAQMACHLTPYFHLLMHLLVWILMLGPVFGWWTFPYERCNGTLSKVQHNGRPGELEATMMRSWTKLHLLHNLVFLRIICWRTDGTD